MISDQLFQGFHYLIFVASATEMWHMHSNIAWFSTLHDKCPVSQIAGQYWVYNEFISKVIIASGISQHSSGQYSFQMSTIPILNQSLSTPLCFQTRTESTPQSQVHLHDYFYTTGNRLPTETWE